MSRETVVAKRYAKALYEAAAQDGRTLEVEQELTAVVEALTSDKDIVAFITSPNISEEAKWQIIDTSLKGKLSESVISLIKLLIERGRADILPELRDSYIKITSEALGFANADVYTTYPLDEQEQQNVAKEFGELVHKKIRVHNIVDTKLLGGMKVVIGDTLYDGSLAGKLERLEKSFRR
ncbi:F-type H+-transporting ATPase subunit delta [Paenibacillus shirakamiensis]|uniref:ATP synthase subunit delta n=1 Tax=Paenibacillus shirakamiensis TaxID=1265935 RepID=A0ABS4JJD6_9BACL|nr:F0F1 ATP synthase subunit delta [Paenibacillus shirakamiensis]MBP2001818.1 F-type H+-transporting ATPase subunit delta [Paenibacillus shirakamiensis]